jgi:hypothetical protein
MTSTDPASKHDDPDHEHPILEVFNAESVVEDPGELPDEPHVSSDIDAPAP